MREAERSGAERAELERLRAAAAVAEATEAAARERERDAAAAAAREQGAAEEWSRRLGEAERAAEERLKELTLQVLCESLRSIAVLLLLSALDRCSNIILTLSDLNLDSLFM